MSGQLTAEEIAEDIERIRWAFPPGDSRIARLRELASGVRKLGERLDEALSLIEGPLACETWPEWRERQLAFARRNTTPRETGT